MDKFWLVSGILLLIGSIVFLLVEKRENPEKRHIFNIIMIGISSFMVIPSLL